MVSFIERNEPLMLSCFVYKQGADRFRPLTNVVGLLNFRLEPDQHKALFHHSFADPRFDLRDTNFRF